jgi:hypothetical protein
MFYIVVECHLLTNNRNIYAPGYDRGRPRKPKGVALRDPQRLASGDVFR